MEKNIYIPGDLVRLSTPLANDDEIFEVSVCDPSRTLRLGYGKVLKGDYEVVSLDETRHILTWAETIIPIPITPEILEKNKWHHQNSWYFYIDCYKGYLGVEFGDGIPIVDYQNNIICKVKYVHQLQHLLFGLGLDSNLIV